MLECSPLIKRRAAEIPSPPNPMTLPCQIQTPVQVQSRVLEEKVIKIIMDKFSPVGGKVWSFKNVM